MKYSFDDLPKEVAVHGVFDKSCTLDLGEKSEAALKSGWLKLVIQNPGDNPIISDFQLNVSSSSGYIKIAVGYDGSDIVFQEDSSGAYDIMIWRASKIVIGSRTTSNATRIVCSDSEVVTGSDCMFSDGILIQSADQHGLVDLKTGKIFNDKHRRVVLGDHVWLGRRCTLMADVNVGSGSIVGAGAVITSDVPEKSIAVGNPARIVRTDVTWSRSPTSLDIMSSNYVESFS